MFLTEHLTYTPIGVLKISTHNHLFLMFINLAYLYVVMTNIGLDEGTRKSSAEVLNAILADEHVLYMKTRKFHWNVTAKNFKELHVLFEDQYNEIKISIDEIAERVRKLDLFPLGTFKEMLEHASLGEDDGNVSAQQMVVKLREGHEHLIRKIREGIENIEGKGDYGNEDFLTGLLMKHEHTAWMLRATEQ